MNIEMKHNGTRILNGTTGPSQPNLHHLNNHFINQNQLITKSVHHLNSLNSYSSSGPSNNLINHHLTTSNHNNSTNNFSSTQPNSSFVHLNKSPHFTNYHSHHHPHHLTTNHHNFYLTPNFHHYYHHHPLESKTGLYRMNSALNLDQFEIESNLKRDHFGSVSSIGALGNNYPHRHHHSKQIYPTNLPPNSNNNNNKSSTQLQSQEHLLSFYSILKEFKRQNLDQPSSNHRSSGLVNSSANKIQDYLRARSEMSNCDLVNSGNLSLVSNNNNKQNYDKLSHHLTSNHELNNKNKYNNYLNGAIYKHHPSIYHSPNELSSLSAYSQHNTASSLIGSNLALDSAVEPSPRLKKKIYKIWEINKSDKSVKQTKSTSSTKMSGESKNNNSESTGTSVVDGTTRAIFKKFTRIGSSKNVSSSTHSSNSSEQGTIQEEYRSLNQAISTTHLADDPEVRFEEKLRKKAFAHYDCQSLTANLSYASRLCHLLGKRRNTTTGASAASMVAKQNANLNTLDLENGDIDNGDDRSNDLLLSCPYFRNELGGEEERMISLNRLTADQQSNSTSNKSSTGNNKTIFIHKPNMTSGLALLEDANEKRWKLKCCPYQKLNTISTPNLEHLFLIENNDIGATYYRNNFYGLEHQNWFGHDDNLGPIAISIRRERVPLENCSLINVNSTSSSANTNTAITQQMNKNQYRIIIRTSELNVLRGTVFEDCVPGLNMKNNNHNNHHAKEILDYIAPEINLSCLRLGMSNADESLLRLDEQAQTGKYKVGVLYCKSGQSTEEEMYNNEYSGPAFEEFLTCLGKKVRLKGFENYRAGLDNKNDTTGLHSIYSTFAGCEIMFHVSTLLPYATDKQQIPRKQHIGNDIVTIVFQEPDACQFTPKLIRSHFQHVFIIVKVLPSLNGQPKYSVAISRSKDVPVFGPPIPENGIFTKSKQFTDFLLSKIINAENAAHRSEKFRSMAQRTRYEYLKELATKYITNTTINDLSGSSAGSKLVNSIFGGSKKSRSNRASRDSHFIGDAVIKGAICWEMWVEDFGQSKVIDCLVAISSDSLVIIEESTKELIFVTPNVSVLGWSSHPNYIKIFYHQGECILLKCKDPDLDEINEIVNRLKNVTSGCETSEIILKRNNAGQLGFHVGFDGIITHVDMYSYAWQAGLRRYARIVEICKVAIATLSYEQMQDLLKTSITVSITTLPQHNEHSPRRGCNLQSCTYVTNPLAFTSSQRQAGNYENINNVFNRFQTNPQLNGQTSINKGYLNTSGSLNYNQSINSSQNQIMGLPSTNTMQSRTSCSSPASNSSSITTKSSPTAGIGLLNSSGLSRSKTMLDSSTSSSKKLLCSVPSTPTISYSSKQQTSGTFSANNKSNLQATTSSIASSIQDSLNQLTDQLSLSLSTTSSQIVNSVSLQPQQIECSELGLPIEPIKMNLTTSKQTSDYNSDTSSSNEWSLSLDNSANRAKLQQQQQKLNNSSNNTFKTPFTPVVQSKTADKSQQTSSASLLHNTYNSIRQQALQNKQQQQSSETNSTLQEDLLRLINPDNFSYDNGDSELNSNSSNQASNESSNTQYSTPYSSLERSNTSCSNKDYNHHHQSTNEDKKNCAVIAQSNVVSNNRMISNQMVNNNIKLTNSQLFDKPKLEKTQSMETLCKNDNKLNSFNDKKSQSASKTKKYSFDSNSTTTVKSIDQEWPRSLVNNANKALAVTQQANSQPINSMNKKSLFKDLQQQDKSSSKENLSPVTLAAATLNQHRNSLDEWIKEFENFSKNAGTMFGASESLSKRFSITNSTDADQADDSCFQMTRPIEPSRLDTEKVKNLEDRLKQLQSDLVREQSSKLTLEEQVKHLEEENRRLHNESITAAAQLRKFTEWFFQNINAK